MIGELTMVSERMIGELTMVSERMIETATDSVHLTCIVTCSANRHT